MPSEIKASLPDMPGEFWWEMRSHEDEHDWRRMLLAARAAPRSGLAQYVMTWQESTVGSHKSLPMYTLSVANGMAVTADLFLLEPTSADIARHLLLFFNPPARGRAPPKPGSLMLAARMAHMARELSPLLDWLGIPLVIESWRAAAESALEHGTSIWGHNAFKRCVACRACTLELTPVRGRPPCRRVEKLKKCSGASGRAMRCTTALTARALLLAARWCFKLIS